MKVFDKFSYKILIIVFSAQFLVSILGILISNKNELPYAILIISVIGIGLAIYSKRIPYVAVNDKSVIKFGLFKNQEMALDEIQAIQNGSGELILESDSTLMKLKTANLDASEIVSLVALIRQKAGIS
ncbi:hypothetical protein MM239_04275 [Belliella sp. DSM 111904]|uniref:PH domain-containing protein n=1 Tax=Belliella filtrata TaxID=2923435 RepID=A0ABS9UWR3_9BACT|nr:hypothetical protein [Belliella filtrata]MCH7408599.1 hypothetical protein [Belliella filtrata]